MILSVIKEGIGRLFRIALGRKLLLRVSRFFLNEARLDFNNSINKNGEADLQKLVLNLNSKKSRLIAFDVGANIGEWTSSLIAADVNTMLKNASIYCFEPSMDTFQLLQHNLRKYPAYSIHLENKALSNRNGVQTLFIAGIGLGINSLHQNSQATSILVGEEKIVTVTLDHYCSSLKIDSIDLLKIDAEGHDYFIIEGAANILKEAKIEILQFEYNRKWIDSRHFLKDVFDLIEGLNYQVGKLTRYGVEFYDKWDSDLETFVEGNYLIIKKDLKGKFIKIRWWKY